MTPNRSTRLRPARLALVCVIAFAASACAGTRDKLRAVGQTPVLAPVEDPRQVYGGQPVMMPMPAYESGERQGNSLWRSGARTFFGDPRASRIGDILTVEIAIDDRASLSNSTTRSRSASEEAGISALGGLENLPGAILPGGFDPANLAGFDSTTANQGRGAIDRAETIELTVAALVTDILPNGNFVIAGRQEVRINHEVRELTVAGVVRPEDITASNTIRHTDIAEARIAYGGRGVVSDLQQPKYGQQIYEILFPF